MFKQIISLFAVFALSALVVFFMPQAQQAMHFLVSAHDWVSNILTNVFNGGNAGNIVRELVALLTIPLAAGLVPAILFFLLRKRWLPCFMEIVWIIWLVQAGALVMVYSGPATGAMAAPSASITTPAAEEGPEAGPEAAPEAAPQE